MKNIRKLSCVGIVLMTQVFLVSCSDNQEGSKQAAEAAVDQQNEAWDGKSDFGGTLVQSYTAGVDGKLSSIRIAVEGQQNGRELLVTLRKSDKDGFPMGKVLASGVVDVFPRPKPAIAWHVVVFEKPYHQQKGESLCLCFSPSAMISGDYGYIEYAYSNQNKYPEGRVNSSSRGKELMGDDGKDLCFMVVVNATQKADQ